MLSPMRLFHGCTSALALARRSLGDSAGNATIELALAFSLICVPLMLGTLQAAFMVYDSIEVSNAAHAGAVYGMGSSTLAQDSTGIQTAAQAEAADFGTGLSISSSSYYVCSTAMTGTQYATQAAASAICPSGANHPLQFVQVASSANVTPPIQVPGLPKTWTLRGSSLMEVAQQ